MHIYIDILLSLICEIKKATRCAYIGYFTSKVEKMKMWQNRFWWITSIIMLFYVMLCWRKENELTWVLTKYAARKKLFRMKKLIVHCFYQIFDYYCTFTFVIWISLHIIHMLHTIWHCCNQLWMIVTKYLNISTW